MQFRLKLADIRGTYQKPIEEALTSKRSGKLSGWDRPASPPRPPPDPCFPSTPTLTHPEPEGIRRPRPARPVLISRPVPKQHFRPADPSPKAAFPPGPRQGSQPRPLHLRSGKAATPAAHKSDAPNSAEQTRKLTLSKTRLRPHVFPRMCVITPGLRMPRLHNPHGRRFRKLHFRRPGCKEAHWPRMLSAVYGLSRVPLANYIGVVRLSTE